MNDVKMHFVYPIEPEPKRRHRSSIGVKMVRYGDGISRRKMYPKQRSDLRTKRYETLLGREMAAQVWNAAPKLFPIAKPLSVKIIFYCPNKLSDLDNLVKSVLDAGNKILWADDRFIEELYSRVYRKFSGTPRIELTVDTCEIST